MGAVSTFVLNIESFKIKNFFLRIGRIFKLDLCSRYQAFPPISRLWGTRENVLSLHCKLPQFLLNYKSLF